MTLAWREFFSNNFSSSSDLTSALSARLMSALSVFSSILSSRKIRLATAVEREDFRGEGVVDTSDILDFKLD